MQLIKLGTRAQFDALMRKYQLEGYKWFNGDDLLIEGEMTPCETEGLILHVDDRVRTLGFVTNTEAPHRLAHELVGDGHPRALIERVSVRDVNIELPMGVSVNDVRRAMAKLLDVEASKITMTFSNLT